MDIGSILLGAAIGAIPTVAVAVAQGILGRRTNTRQSQQIGELIATVNNLKARWDAAEVAKAKSEGKVVTPEDVIQIHEASTVAIQNMSPLSGTLFLGGMNADFHGKMAGTQKAKPWVSYKNPGPDSAASQQESPPREPPNK